MAFFTFARIFTLLALMVTQWSATISGVQYLLGGYKILSFIIAFTIGSIPFVGGILGAIGAINVWEWHWFWAIGLFFGIPAIMMTAIFSMAGYESIKEKISSKKAK